MPHAIHRAGLLLAATGLAALAGCAQPNAGEETAEPAEPVEEVMPVEPPPAGAPGGTEVPVERLPAEVREAVVKAAAEAAGVAPEAVHVLRVESVTWSDAALGCPQPGQMYTQALVPGYRVIVHAGTQEIEYHTSERGQVVQCEGDGGTVSPPGVVER